MSGSLRQEEDFRVDGTLDANSSADIAGAVNMQSTLAVAGASTLAAASFSGAIDANSTADFQGDVNLQADLDVAGGSTVQAIVVQGAIDANSTADFQGDVNLQAALDVAGASTLAAASFSGAIDANSTSDFAGAMNLQDAITVAGAADLNGALDVAGAASLAASGVLTDIRGTLSVDEAAVFDSSVAAVSLSASAGVSGISITAHSADINGAADIEGAANLQSTLAVAGASTLAAASFSGAIDANSTADFQGDVNLQAALDVAGASTLAAASFSGAIDANSTADFQGDVNLQAALAVAGASTLAAASFSGAIDANSTADFQGAVNLQDTLTVAGALDANSSADIQGALNLQDSVQFDSADRKISYHDGMLDIVSDAILALSASTGMMLQAPVGVYLSDTDLIIEDANEDAKFEVFSDSGNFEAQGTAAIQGATSLYSTLDVQDSVTVSGSSDVGLTVSSIYTGGASITAVGHIGVGASGEFDAMMFSDGRVSGSSNFQAGGDLIAAGALDVEGAGDIKGALNLQSTLTIAGALDANSSADFQGAVNLQDTLNVDGAATMAAITADGAIDLSNASIQFSADLDTAFDVSADAMYFRDSDGSLKSRSWATIMGQIAGAGLTATNGVLAADGAVAPSAWSDGGTLAEGVNYAGDLGSGAAQSMTLPVSGDSEAGDSVSVKAAALPGGATLTVNAAAGQNIDGSSSIVLESPYAAVTMVYVAANTWRIV
jgi:cytoskeletal protein CcmA (bactofilin family)